MQVIGRQSEDKVILTASVDEIATLMWEASRYSTVVVGNSKFDVRAIPVGTIFELSENYKRATEAVTAYTTLRTNFESIKKQLSRIMSLVDGKIIPEEKKQS